MTILAALWTGHKSGNFLSAVNVMDWPFCLFFWIRQVIFTAATNSIKSIVRFLMICFLGS
jgi:hypothetical protein